MKYALTAALAAILMIGCSGETASTASASDMSAPLSAELPALTGEYVWDMVSSKSVVNFTAYYNGDFTGEFQRFQTAIRLNPEAPEGGEIHAIVDLSSVAVKDDDVKSNLPTSDWFDVAAHPYATFNSKTITALGGGNYAAKGDLRIKGISQPADLTFALIVDGDTARATGGLEILRTDFNIGTGPDFQTEDWVKFPVSISVDITANRGE